MTRAVAKRLLAVAVTLGAFVYLWFLIDLQALLGAFAKITVSALVVSVGFVYLTMAAGALRWLLLLRAMHAPRPPSFVRLLRYYLIGLFYNTYLPGGVGGDLIRAIASRDAFGQDGATQSVAVVLLERVLGLAALLVITATVLLVQPLPGVSIPPALAAVGLVLALGSVLALVVARRLVPLLPPPLSRWAAMLPVPASYRPLVWATLPALASQLGPAFAGHALVVALAPHVSLMESLVVVPLAMSATYVPITVSGAGVREAIFVQLYSTVGVAKETALAASLLLWLCQVVVAATGGLLVLLSPPSAAAPKDA